MDSLSLWINSLPPLTDFFPPTPEAYAILLSLFQYFPVVTIAQWLLPFYPQGKTSLTRSILNFPGRYAWCFMESIGAINLLYILIKHNNDTDTASHLGNGADGLPPWHKVLVILYVLHYLNRAVITPLFIAPSMSPIHLIIISFAMTYNYFNSSCLAGWLLGYGTPAIVSPSDPYPPSDSVLLSYIPYIGLALFLTGMYGNIRAENTLFKLRKQEARRRDRNNSSPSGSMYDKVYIIPPPTGYFRFILFPHYVFEWLEWFGFLLIGFSVTSCVSGAGAESATSNALPLAPYYAPVADFLVNKCGLPFPFPAIMFLVNSILTMGARASWGRRWYADKFGGKAVAGRSAFIPYFKWL